MDSGPKFDEELGDDQDIDIYPVRGEALLVRKLMLNQGVNEEEDWRRSIFRTNVRCKGKACMLVIDSGRMENIVAKEAVDKPGLKVETHPRPYKIGWVKKGCEVPINTRCLVKFNLGDRVEAEITCDMVPMDVGYILLGRLWLFDNDVIDQGKSNTYSFMKEGKKYTLRLIKEEQEVVSGSKRKGETVNALMSIPKVEYECTEDELL